MVMQSGNGVIRDGIMPELYAVSAEYNIALAKYGDRLVDNDECPDGTRMMVLTDEVGEVARCFTKGNIDPQHLHQELVQVAMVALAWAKAVRTAWL